METRSQAAQAVAEGWGAPRTREVAWYDPLAAAARARELSGRAFLEGIIDGRFAPPPIASLFGAELVSVGEGEAVFSCVPDESSYNPIGMVHGGWLCTLLDSAAGCAVHTLLPAGTGYSSIEIKVSYLKPVRAGEGPIEARGSVLRLGRRVAFAEAHAYRADGEPVGHATSSIAVIGGARA
jgi:uncharacterized protein (TIGR00369 family)